MITISNRANKITRTSKQKTIYADFENDFRLDPVTGNLTVVTNDDAIKLAFKNLVLTDHGERFYHREIGSDINKSLFNPIDDITVNNIRTSILDIARNFEPRVQNLSVSVVPHPLDNMYEVTIKYSDINNQPQTLVLPLSVRVR